jgi:membrane protease YdiL (CAAX protease family)
VSRVRRPPLAHPSDRPPPEAATRPGWLPRRPIPDDRSGPPNATEGSGLDVQPAARPVWMTPVGLLAMAVIYPAAFHLRVLPFWPAMAAVSAISWWVAWHPYLPTRLRPTRRLVTMGVVSGLVLYALFCAGALLVRETPLWPRVEDVVDLARTSAPGTVAALLIVLLSSPGEEVLWRGAVFARLTRRYGPGWRPVIATTLLYALFVGLSGNSVLPLAALVCGLVWARQRQVTGSIVPSLVSHALWSLLIFLYIPGLPWP